jgi:hypothetical protein
MTWFVELLHRDGSVLVRKAVTGNTLTLGRALDNDIVVDDLHCAAHHARLQIDAQGAAVLQDLGTHNGIKATKMPRATSYVVSNDSPYTLGHASVRIRHSTWALPPEQSLPTRAMWPLALVAVALVLGHIAWNLWRSDVGEKSPPYLYGLFGTAAGLCVWSGVYALLGRLISGMERFFTHLLIASGGYLIISVVGRSLEILSFATTWLWPLRIDATVTIILIALLVRAHLRVADPRHWPVLRWAVALVTVSAIVVPVAQLWISDHRLTNIQTLKTIEHPALRIAAPVDIARIADTATALKAKADVLRTKESNEEFSGDDD